MARKDARTTRVQVYINDPKVLAGLQREARAAQIPLSQAAARAIARGLQKGRAAGPSDQSLQVPRWLLKHLRAVARDLMICHELQVESMRAIFLRLPDFPREVDAAFRAAADMRVEEMVRIVAARVVQAERTVREQARAAAEDRGLSVIGEPRVFGEAAE